MPKEKQDLPLAEAAPGARPRTHPESDAPSARRRLLDPRALWPLGLGGPGWPVPVLVFAVILVGLLPFEHAISQLATGASAEIVAVFAVITRFGESDWILVPAAIVMLITIPPVLFARGRPLALHLARVLSISSFVFLGVGVPGLAAALLKRAIGRPRPVAFDVAGTLGFHPFALSYSFESFPSGHSTTAAAFAMVVIFLLPRVWPLAFLYALAVMVSRLIVGAHYPDDVLGGLALGVLGAYAIRNLFASRNWLFVFTPDGRVRLAVSPVA